MVWKGEVWLQRFSSQRRDVLKLTCKIFDSKSTGQPHTQPSPFSTSDTRPPSPFVSAALLLLCPLVAPQFWLSLPVPSPQDVCGHALTSIQLQRWPPMPLPPCHTPFFGDNWTAAVWPSTCILQYQEDTPEHLAIRLRSISHFTTTL